MLKINRSDDGVIHLVGRFDASAVEGAEAALSRLSGGARLDLSGLDYISSTGITVMLRAWKRAEEAGETFCVINASRTVRRIFRNAGLEKVFDSE